MTSKKVIYSESFIEFLKKSDSAIAKVLFRLHHKRYDSNLLTTDEINFLTFRGDGTISYLPNGKELIYNERGEWKKDNRQNGKPAKVIKKLFTKRALKYFKDVDFEAFSNNYKAVFNDDGYRFEMMPNDSIPSVYNMKIKEGGGSLNNSCMNGDGRYLDIYKNCKQLQILTLINSAGELCGRSLIWKVSDEITLMDRIYITDDFMYSKFLDYANDSGYWTKKDYKSYHDKTTFITKDGEEISKHLTIETETDFETYPYIDTFSYGDDGLLSNKSGQYTYNNTDGSRDGDNSGQVYDDINDRYIDEEDSVYIESGESQYRDRMTHIDDAVEVAGSWYYKDDCNIVYIGNYWYRTDDYDNIREVNGEYYHIDDCVYSERDNTDYLAEDCVYSDKLQDYILESEAVKVGDDFLHQDDVVEIDGVYYDKDDESIKYENGIYSLINEEEETA